MAAFAIGQTVRIVSPPYKSMLGTLTNLKQGFSVLPSGIQAQVAEVRLSNEGTVEVPLSNLEIIG
jgi:transcription antitermination factor NusG